MSKQLSVHPLSPLAASEITRSSELIKSIYPRSTDLYFKAISLEEPEKALLGPYLQAEHNGRKRVPIDRKAFVCYYIRNTVGDLRKTDTVDGCLGGY